MIGVLTNTAAVLVGSLIGLLFKKGIPERIADALMKGLGLCTVAIGITGLFKGENTLILILSIAIGGLIGTLLKLDDNLNKFGSFLEEKLNRKGDGKVSIAQGFVSASLLFCVGAMTIVGSLQAGLTGDNEMLFTKSLLDLVSSTIFSATLGIGVMLSAGFVLVFQGSIALLAQYVSPVLTESVIAEMTCVGSLLILALGLNLIGLTKLKIVDYLPAIFLPILLCLFM